MSHFCSEEAVWV